MTHTIYNITKKTLQQEADVDEDLSFDKSYPPEASAWDDISDEEIRQASFDLFWKEYPKKINKKLARKAWDKIYDQLPDEGRGGAEILDILERQKKSQAWQAEGGRFIPHPANYLLKEKWTDELFENESAQRPVEDLFR